MVFLCRIPEIRVPTVASSGGGGGSSRNLAQVPEQEEPPEAGGNPLDLEMTRRRMRAYNTLTVAESEQDLRQAAQNSEKAESSDPGDVAAKAVPNTKKTSVARMGVAWPPAWQDMLRDNQFGRVVAVDDVDDRPGAFKQPELAFTMAKEDLACEGDWQVISNINKILYTYLSSTE